MTIKSFILGTAGHIDHGKSALVKAFTGIDPDRLPEEKTRGMTIDLGFAQMKVPSPADPAVTYSLGLVDVPGHSNFINNMVSGIGGIDLALFVVAADDGWMPQSEEHMQILSYLGIHRAVVALTKADLADDLKTVTASVREELQGTPFSEAPIVPTSVIDGSGIEALKETIGRAFDASPLPRDIGKPRLPIDRVFTRPGAGTVVTGTLTGGRFHRNQNVVIQPHGLPARIRGLQAHNEDHDQAVPGTRCAVNLGDATIASRKEKGVERGDIVTIDTAGKACDTINISIRVDARGKPRPLKHGAQVRWHHGGSHAPARIYFLREDELAPGNTTGAQIRFASPVFAFIGDRFILRNWAGSHTIAGGTVLETGADRKGYRGEAQHRFLKDAEDWVGARLKRDRWIGRKGLLQQSNYSEEEIAGMVRDEWVHGDWLIEPDWWETLQEKATGVVDAFHQTHPELKGLPLNDFRSAFRTDIAETAIIDELAKQLADLVIEGAEIRRASHQTALPPHLEAAQETIRNALSAKPLEPPSRKEVTPDPDARNALKLMLDAGEAVAIGNELVMLKEHFEKANGLIVRCIQELEGASISELREYLGTTRRVVLPLVERLDREGVTVREGDLRVLKA